MEINFTLFGLDGYLSYRIKTYFIVGEWFLGAIIIIYILYPLLLCLMNKNIFIIYFIIGAFYFIMYKEIINSIFIIIKDINIITCINSFYFGMISIKFKHFFFDNKTSLTISMLLFLFLCFIKLNNFILIHQIQGFSLYIILIQIGTIIMFKYKAKILNEISTISFSIYLIHHRISLYIF